MKPENLLASIATAGVLVLGCLSQCSCTLTIHPDGRKTVKPNPELMFQSLRIIAEK